MILFKCFFVEFEKHYLLSSSSSGVDGFKEWYQEKQEILRNDNLARFFVDARNDSQKVGLYHINTGSASRETGNLTYKYYFIDFHEQYSKNHDDFKDDIVILCNILVDLVFDSFAKFGEVIDPDRYYTVSNLSRLGKTIEDIEAELGYPREFTDVGGSDCTLMEIPAGDTN